MKRFDGKHYETPEGRWVLYDEAIAEIKAERAKWLEELRGISHRLAAHADYLMNEAEHVGRTAEKT